MMKLTKDDFILARHGKTKYSRCSKLLTNEDINQILKNQEIVERLKKRIEELNKYYRLRNDGLLTELQKILEGKDDNL